MFIIKILMFASKTSMFTLKYNLKIKHILTDLFVYFFTQTKNGWQILRFRFKNTSANLAPDTIFVQISDKYKIKYIVFGQLQSKQNFLIASHFIYDFINVRPTTGVKS
uniref:PxGV-Torf79 protein n=1 Tax=Plutella xylostella granulovirus TaxID=98383 RepID=A0A142DWS4_9BBAC|nr:PxGV-Torf79 protein [Plutella xylostella granulovirus]